MEWAIAFSQSGGDPAMAAALGLARFGLFSGVASAGAPLERAAVMAHQAGDTREQAWGTERLGDIALRRSDHESARRRYEEALPLYRQVGAVLGEANCIQRLGDIALRTGSAGDARNRFLEALDLYRNIPEPYSIGQTLQRLARREKNERERGRLLAQTVSLWEGIGRGDLVEALRREFPGEA